MFQEMHDRVDEIRKKLYEIMYKKPYSPAAVAKIIGVQPQTITRFLDGKKDVRFTSLCKIANFIEAEEQHDKL